MVDTMSGIAKRHVVSVLTALLFSVVLADVSCAQTPGEANEAGKAAYQRGDFVAAERFFSAAATAMPGEALFHYHRGAALVRLGRFAEARGSYGRALALKPSGPLAASIQAALRDFGPAPTRASAGSGDVEAIPLAAMNGVWVAEVTLNHSRRARFLVDTGATTCTISPALAEELAIVPPETAPLVKFMTLNGPVEGRMVSLESIRVGDMEANDISTLVYPLDAAFDGILGNSFLSRFAATVDAERRVLYLKPRS
jgi:clan AA aspartic protease (TIGR02281 family)